MTIVNAASVTLERVVPSTVAELQRESVWVFFLVVYPQGFKHGQTRRVALSPRTPVAVAATTTMTAEEKRVPMELQGVFDSRHFYDKNRPSSTSKYFQ